MAFKIDILQRGAIKILAPKEQDPVVSFPSPFSVAEIARRAAEAFQRAAEASQQTEPSNDWGRIVEEAARKLVKETSKKEEVPETHVPPAPPVSVDTVPRSVESKLSPVMDSVEVFFDPAGGVADAFFCKIRVLVSANDFQKLKAVRLCRSSSTRPSDVVQSSILGVSRLFSSAGRKNPVGISLAERIFSANGQAGVLEQVGIDPIRGIRKSTSKETRKNESSATSMSDVQRKISVQNARSLTGVSDHGLDQSVSDDPKTMSRVVPKEKLVSSQKRSVVGKAFVPSESFGKLGIAARAAANSEGTVALTPDMGQFKELFLVTPGESNSRRLGQDLYEVFFEDRSVIRGKRFTYYAVLIDDEMKESRRSDAVTALVDKQAPPQRPQAVVVGSSSGVSVSMKTDDFLVERFEVYRRESFFLDKTDSQITVVRSGGGVSSESSAPVKSGWLQLDEVPAGVNGTATLIDRRVVPGRTYEYRVYAVDCFGNKSCSPAEGVQHFPAPDRVNDLKRPLITAEVDQRTRRIKVGIVNDEPRVGSLFVARREVGLREKSFRAPHEPDVPIFGNVQASRSTALLTNPVMFSKDGSWTGHFFSPGTGSVGFIDQTVRFDRSYQYVAWGVDRRGEKTQYDFSQPVFVSRNPLVDAPSQFTASVTSGSVELAWNDPTLTFSPDDIMGNQESLANSSVRHMYQLQRKRFGGSSWDSFPLTKDQAFSDPISNGRPPRFRPPYARLGDTYLYRVAVLQSGALYSNYTDPLVVKVDPRPEPPASLAVKSGDPRARPGFVVLSWDDGPGVVDYWEVQRFACNNFFSANLVMNEETLLSLPFENVANVTLESSRANARTADQHRKRDPGLFVGDRYYIDSDVFLGNTYVYKVVAVSPFGSRSEPSYRAILLSNRAFEMKSRSVLSSEELARLARDPEEIVLSSEVRR